MASTLDQHVKHVWNAFTVANVHFRLCSLGVLVIVFPYF